MKGHQTLIDMRRDGFKPPLVFVDTDPTGCIDEWLNATGDSVHVWIEPTDSAKRLDCRCFIGCAVSLTGKDRRRVEAVSSAIKAVGASRVIAAVLAPNCEVLSIDDTLGVLTWLA